MDHIIAPELSEFEDRWHFSHAVRHDGLLFFSGITGTRGDGHVDHDPATQFEQAFTHLRWYLDAAGASISDILELTSYHVDLREHLAAFTAAKDRHIPRPFPAWSAIGVSQLITPGALVELRIIARAPHQPPER
jgi:enamine deaminase RidA (YjgF/YER057c/UK114 family)